jgi:hypothetical protein
LSDSFLTVLFWDGMDDSSLPQLPEAAGVGCNAIVRGDLSREARSAPQQTAPGMFGTRTVVAALVTAIHICLPQQHVNGRHQAGMTQLAGTTDAAFNFKQQTQLRDLAAQFARGLRRLPPSETTRGRRESRVRAAPAVSRAKWL